MNKLLHLLKLGLLFGLLLFIAPMSYAQRVHKETYHSSTYDIDLEVISHISLEGDLTINIEAINLKTEDDTYITLQKKNIHHFLYALEQAKTIYLKNKSINYFADKTLDVEFPIVTVGMHGVNGSSDWWLNNNVKIVADCIVLEGKYLLNIIGETTVRNKQGRSKSIVMMVPLSEESDFDSLKKAITRYLD